MWAGSGKLAAERCVVFLSEEPPGALREEGGVLCKGVPPQVARADLCRAGPMGTGGRRPEPGFPPSTDKAFCSPVGVSALGRSQALGLILRAGRCVGWLRAR